MEISPCCTCLVTEVILTWLAGITNEAGEAGYPSFRTGTTHATWNGMGTALVCISFGKAMGFKDGGWQDVHGGGLPAAATQRPPNRRTIHGPGPTGGIYQDRQLCPACPRCRRK
jgi:hypothetical protein